MTLVNIEKVAKEFGYKNVLKNVNLTLAPQNLTLLLGKNGAGKSTLMKIISGLTRPSKGRVLFKGQDISKDPELFRRSVAVISHSLHLYAELSAVENLIFFSKLGKRKNSRAQIYEALEKTGLKPFADIPVKTFSSGMGKRLSIAKLMLSAPQILLLDEPYTGLDYQSVELFNNYLTEFKDQGGAIMLISHQIEICFPICDQAAILENGSIRWQKKADDLDCDQLMTIYKNLTEKA